MVKAPAGYKGSFTDSDMHGSEKCWAEGQALEQMTSDDAPDTLEFINSSLSSVSRLSSK